MNSFPSFIFCLSVWFSLCTIETKSETGLLFEAKTEKLDEIRRKFDENEDSSLMVACPAKSELELQFNQDFSNTKNSLFVKTIHKGKYKDYVDRVQTNICDTSFEAKMVFNKRKSTYETGYEFLYPEGAVDLKCNKYYDLVEENSVIKKVDVLVDNWQTIFKNVKFVLPDGQTLLYYWVSVLSFKFNPTYRQIRINLKGDIVNDHYTLTMDDCEDYDLGEEFFIDSEKNLYPFSTELEQGETNVESLKIVKTPVMPTMFLHTKAGKIASCTAFNTIPVYKGVLDGRLKFVDQYLYSLYKLHSSNMNIIFGTTDLKKKEEESSSESNDEKIIMPDIIYRVVEYIVPMASITSNFYIIIIIHNDLNPIEKPICINNIPTWEAIDDNENPKTDGTSYACATTWDIFQKLGAFDERITTLSGDLRLNEFVTEIDPNTGVAKKSNILNDIAAEMKKLFGVEVKKY